MPIVLDVEVSGDDFELAEAIQALLNQVLDAGIDARLPTTQPPENSKSSTATAIGQIVVTGLLSGASVGALTQILLAFMQRDRSVEIERDGERLKVAAVSRTERRKIIEDFLTRKLPQE